MYLCSAIHSRGSRCYPPGSRRYEDNPILIKCKDGKTEGTYPVREEFTTRPGTYYWNIAVARSVAEEWKWECLSETSETRTFTVLSAVIEKIPIPGGG